MNSELFGEVQEFYRQYFDNSYKKFLKRMEKRKVKITKYEKTYIKDLIIYLNKVVFNDLLEQTWDEDDTTEDDSSSDSD